MAKKARFFVLFIHFLSFSFRTLAIEYKAAAFEHNPYFVLNPIPLTREEALQVMRRNTAVYSKQARAAQEQEVQIIVFPEDGIYGFNHSRETIKPYLEPIPKVSDATYTIPCTDPKSNTEILQELSCIARNNSIAVVANMGDIQYCTKSDPNCPQDGRYQYNTDVVFDSDGRLLAKYHKQHLFHEEAFNTPTECEFVTFVTSFQARFGVFTCFDMLFKDPAIDLVQSYGVENIVFPTAWFKGFPALISIEFQQAWSRVNCVNLIAANLYFPGINFTGSGIYSCGEVKTYVYDKEPAKQRLLTATLSGTKQLSRNEMNDALDHKAKQYRRDIEMFGESSSEGKISQLRVNNANEFYLGTNRFKVQLMGNLFTVKKLIASASELSVCANDLCCNLKYSLPEGRKFTETFAMGTFKGDNPNGFYWEVCLLFKCASNEETSCGKDVVDSGTVFESIAMYGNFSSNAFVFPTALGNGVSLFSKDQFKFTKKGIAGEAFENQLLAASLIGRVFGKDKPQK